MLEALQGFGPGASETYLTIAAVPTTVGQGEFAQIKRVFEDLRNIARPMPSMPVGFWNDADGARYRAAYFERFPGVWCHGDYVELTAHDGMIFHGRSDATLNPGGVRIGTAEIYREVEQLPEIVESIVVGQDITTDGDKDVRIVLFVRLREGLTLDDALRDRIRRQVDAWWPHVEAGAEAIVEGPGVGRAPAVATGGGDHCFFFAASASWSAFTAAS